MRSLVCTFVFPRNKLRFSHLEALIYMGESFQGYSWLQDFEADFP